MKSFTKNVFLIGYMGVGKSSIGKRLANQLDMPFFDLDNVIEASQNQSVSDIFAQKGTAGFRIFEHDCLLQTAVNQGVISTGGGTPCFGGNMDFMLQKGIVVWLKMPEEIIVSRISPNKEKRPLIANIPTADLLNFVQTHLQSRKPFYERAHIHFNATNINAERITQLVNAIEAYSK